MNKTILPRIYLLCAGVLGLLFAAVQGLLYLFYYDHEVMTYAHDCLPATVAHVALAAAVVAALSAGLMKQGLPQSLPKQKKPALATVSVLCAVAFGGYALLSMAGLLTGREFIYAYAPVFRVLMPVGALCALLFFLAQLRSESAKQTTVAVYGLGLVIFCIIAAFNLFYDNTTPMMDPRKVLRQTALFSAALYLLAEIRYSLAIAKPKWYLIAAAWALLLLPVPAVGMVIGLCAGTFAPSVNTVVCIVADLSLYLYILLRVIGIILPKGASQE